MIKIVITNDRKRPSVLGSAFKAFGTAFKAQYNQNKYEHAKEVVASFEAKK